MKALPAAAAAALVVFPGCDAAGPAPVAVVEHDSAGIIIVENRGPYPAWRASVEPELRLGAVAGDSAFLFHRVGFAGRLADGGLVVVDGGSREVRWFSPDGSHRATAAGRGEGPGELAVAGSAVLTSGDSLVIHDPRLRRLTWFSPEGRHVRQLSMSDAPSGTVTLVGAVPPEGMAVAISRPVFLLQPDHSFSRDSMGVFVAREAGLDTLAWGLGSENAAWVRMEGGRAMAVQETGLPFAHKVLAGASEAGLVLAVGTARQRELRDWSGGLRRLSRRSDRPPEPLTDEHLDRHVDHSVGLARREDGTVPAGVEDWARSLLAVLPEGHTVPDFDAIRSAGDGTVWLRAFAPRWEEDADRVWTVHDGNGRVRRQVTVPAGLELLHAGAEHVTGVVRDSLGVEFVVVHRLEPVEGG